MGSVDDVAGRQLGRVTAKLLHTAKPSAVRDRAVEFGRTLQREYEAGKRDDPDPAPAEEAATADEVAGIMHKVDWAKVKAATSDRTTETAQSMKAMAGQVDWDKVTPVAAQVSSALIAAVASGQIPLGGALGGRVARTIMNDRNLAQKVAATLRSTPDSMPPDFRGAIETTATES